MSRKEFLGQLERLLWDIPEQERKEALEYYRDYFDDAGEENEASVIQELGSPGKVAAIIKADLEENREEYGEYTENGYADERFDDRDMPETRQSSESFHEKQKENNWGGNRYHGQAAKQGKSGLSIALVLVLLLVTLPIWGGVGLGLIGAVIGLICACIGVIAALLFGGIGLIVVGILVFIYALISLLSTPATAMVIIGTALILVAVGLLFMVAFLWLALKAFPKCFRWFVDFVQRVLHRGDAGGDRR